MLSLKILSLSAWEHEKHILNRAKTFQTNDRHRQLQSAAKYSLPPKVADIAKRISCVILIYATL